MNIDEFAAAWEKAGGLSGVRIVFLKGGHGDNMIYASHYCITRNRREKTGEAIEEWDSVSFSRLVGKSLLIQVASVRLEDVEKVA